MAYNKGKYSKNFDTVFKKTICTNCIFGETCDFKDNITENTCVLFTKENAL